MIRPWIRLINLITEGNSCVISSFNHILKSRFVFYDVLWNISKTRNVLKFHVLFHCFYEPPQNSLMFSPTFSLPRWWADLSGPSHHPDSCGLGDGPQGGWPELPLPEESSPHEDHQPGPFCSPGEDQTRRMRLSITSSIFCRYKGGAHRGAKVKQKFWFFIKILLH